MSQGSGKVSEITSLNEGIGPDDTVVMANQDKDPRERKLTEEGFTWQSQVMSKAFKSSITKWRRQANIVQEVMSDSKDPDVMRTARRELSVHMDEVSAKYETLDALFTSHGEDNTYASSFEQINAQNYEVNQRLGIIILETEVDVSECDRSSRRSKRSKHSSTSSRTSRADQITEAATEAAVLRAKLKFIDLEAAKKAELSKVQTQMGIEIAEAKLDVIQESESLKLSSVDRHDYVENYLTSQLADDQPNPNVGTPMAKSTPLNPATSEFAPRSGLQQTAFKPNNDTYTETAGPHVTQTPVSQNLSWQIPMMTELTKSFAEQVSLSRLPPPEPDVFKGDPLQYSGWRIAFEALIEHKRIPLAERIYYLKRYLDGPAKETVDGFFISGSFQEAKALLDERYGDPFIVASAFRDKLDAWPQVSPRDGRGLRRFADFLRQCDAAMTSIGSLDVLNDDRENKKLLTKLPDWVTTRWARIVNDWRIDKRCFPPFHHFVRFVIREAEIACDPITSLQALRGPETTDKFKRKPGATSFSTNTRAQDERHAGTHAKPDKKPCFLCKKPHTLESCDRFLGKSIEERREYTKVNGLCYGCLLKGHTTRECRHRKRCNICSKQHPTCLHLDSSFQETPVTRSLSMRTCASGPQSIGQGKKSSMIVPVWVAHRDDPTREKLIYALLDTQSDTTFILQETATSLNIDGPNVTLLLSTMHARDQPIESKKLENLTVRGYDSSVIIPLPITYTRPMIPVNRGHIPTPEMAYRWPHLSKIAHEMMPINETIEVGMLIGYNCPRVLAPRDVIPPSNNYEPYAQRSDLGWGIIGIVDPHECETDRIGVSHRIITRELSSSLSRRDTVDTVDFVLQNRVKEFKPSTVLEMFQQDFSERPGFDLNAPALSHNDQTFLGVVSAGIHKVEGGHYEMPLPFKEEPAFPNNRVMAAQRLVGLKRRLKKDSQYHKDYTKFMSDLIENGFAEEVSPEEAEHCKSWYIPHHGVYNPQKPGKIRVVFDCSAQFQNRSLNAHLLQGPDLSNALVGVLCRFRQDVVAFICDIEQMFYQFRVNPEHRDYLKFLWWKDGCFDSEPIVYRMAVHLFGAASSPGCANYGLKQTANDNELKFGSQAANFIRQDFYVDDGLKSIGSVAEAIELVKNSQALCRQGGLRLHKFVSNSKDVLESVPIQDRAKGIKNLDLHHDKLPVERALGIQWCVESDTFQFKITLKDQPLTRRGVLATVSSIYDPIGFIAPLILIGKQILQQMCRSETDWDSPLPDELRPGWEKWRNGLLALETLNIQRCYMPNDFGKVEVIEIHHFSDACNYGYGQCSFLRLVNDQGRVHCSFLMGKSRVAPVQQVTIPRLELTAAVVSVNVSVLLKKELEYKEAKHIFWTDSQVVLGYIRNDALRFKTFVANRVQQIRDMTDPEQWFYVKSKSNPADEGSRGISNVEQYCKSQWLNGPTFLWQQDVHLSTEQCDTATPSDDPELKKSHVLATLTDDSLQGFDLKRLEYFSDWFRARRAIANCLRYKSILRDRRGSAQDASKTVEELHEAEKEIIRQVQREAFEDEIHTLTAKRMVKKSSTLIRLDPFLDEDGVLRVGGRLSKAHMDIGLRNPVILPMKHHITHLMVQHFHVRTSHQGRGITTNEIRSNGYWIIGCTSAVSQCIARCVVCRKLHGRVEGQKMANLPEDRTNPSPPFTYAAVDLFGPYYVKEGRKELKRYGVIFTCMACRAIHVETAISLSTDSFINALRRFLAIRGPTRQLRSDQGTNFVGARNELYNDVSKLDQNIVHDYLLKQGCDYIKFTMNPPSASHMGGVWERQIRSVRRVLASLLQEAGSQLDDESLRTFLLEATAIVNSRPLTVENLSDPSLEPLTPNHLLTLKSKVLLPPPGDFQKADMYCRKRWKRVQYMADQFWLRWRKEYLQNLQIRQKWTGDSPNLCVGDIVIIKDENVPRSCWSLAKIDVVYKSSDEHVRKVRLVMPSKLDSKGKRLSSVTYLERPIHKLVLLIRSDVV